MISGRTRVFALLGRPVAHSLSPRMHNAAFAAMGLDAVYIALDCGADSVPRLIHALAGAGGGGNVTVPHKAAAATAVGRMDGAPADACNTFWGDAGTAIGANTDVDGVVGAMESLGVEGKSWLIVGTGGSALAVAAAASRCGAAVAVQSRDDARRAEFLTRARQLGAGTAESSACDVVINATPLGLDAKDPLPLSPELAPSARYALDLVYAPGETSWVRAMRAAGALAADGREVLVRQGAAAFTRWFPGRTAPVEVMRAAVRAGLA